MRSDMKRGTCICNPYRILTHEIHIDFITNNIGLSIICYCCSAVFLLALIVAILIPPQSSTFPFVVSIFSTMIATLISLDVSLGTLAPEEEKGQIVQPLVLFLPSSLSDKTCTPCKLLPLLRPAESTLESFLGASSCGFCHHILEAAHLSSSMFAGLCRLVEAVVEALVVPQPGSEVGDPRFPFALPLAPHVIPFDINSKEASKPNASRFRFARDVDHHGPINRYARIANRFLDVWVYSSFGLLVRIDCFLRIYGVKTGKTSAT
ncbi:hypothetical protein CRG98_014191 [Punica granatum]|uniref:Uncharacterized protein n=1 Tax=Punica granatum TaxID=22663 RepID=A0A2I0KA79_PUNGR|nr:hypothetical protein CRG98_014191 [Punica granatum]